MAPETDSSPQDAPPGADAPVTAPDTTAPAGAPDAPPAPAEAPDLVDLTKAELVEAATAAGIDPSGTKADIIERLEQPTVGPLGQPAELHYTGDESGEPHLDGVPAADLTSAQVDHLVYVRTMRTQEGTDAGLVPGDDGFKAARKELVSGLVLTGLYDKE